MKLEVRQETGLKDSGADWIGLIPKNWKTKRFKDIASHMSRGTTPDYADAITDFGVINQACIFNDKIDYKKLKYNRVAPREGEILLKGDMLFTATGIGTVGRVNIFNEDAQFIADTHIMVIRDDLRRFDPGFLRYVFFDKQELITRILASGATNQIELQREKLQEFLIPFPPKKEQEEIALFLNAKFKQLQDFISLKHQQLGLLQEYEKSVIHSAVTTGLDPDKKMKKSEVEWIGLIPDTWKVSKISQVCNVNGRVGWQGLTTDDYTETGPLLLGAGDIQEGNLAISSSKRIPYSFYNDAQDIQVQNKDLLLVKVGATIGKTCVVNKVSEPMTVNAALFVIKTKPVIDPDYLNYLLSSQRWQEQILMKVAENARGNLFQRDFNRIQCLLPPFEIQLNIVKYLKSTLNKIHIVLQNSKIEIDRIEEYQKSLIYEVTTGKVRLS
jgi:type I restriction enzyme, S subunit